MSSLQLVRDSFPIKAAETENGPGTIEVQPRFFFNPLLFDSGDQDDEDKDESLSNAIA